MRCVLEIREVDCDVVKVGWVIRFCKIVLFSDIDCEGCGIDVKNKEILGFDCYFNWNSGLIIVK